MKKIKIGGLKILSCMLGLFMLGCSSPNNKKHPLVIASYTLPSVKINIVESVEDINLIYNSGNKLPIQALAFYDPKTNTAWIPKNPIPDENGKIIPNLFLLGHEIWHAVDLEYHSNTNTLYSYPILPKFTTILLKD